MDDIFPNEMAAPHSKGGRNKPSVDRLPPHSPEAETGVLACILLDPITCMPQCLEQIGSRPDVFYDLRHQTIFRTMTALYAKNTGIDVITLSQGLKDSQQLEQIGGLSYLGSILEAAVSAENLSYYLEILLDKWLCRKLISTCTDAVGRLYDAEGEINTVIDEIERDVLAVGGLRLRAQDVSSESIVTEVIRDLEIAWENSSKLTGIESGFSDLDRILDGLRPGMHVLAARPGAGKTSLVLNIADHVACNVGLPVGIISLEMSRKALMRRMIAARSGVNLRALKPGLGTEANFQLVTTAAGRLAKAPIYIEDTPGLSIMQVRAKARRWWQQYGIKLLAIDYLQLLNAVGMKRKYESRQQEVSDISNGIQSLAKELGIPVIVLSQLNRDVDRGPARRPRMSDLRESGTIEQDADTVGLLSRAADPEDVENEESPPPIISINLEIVKQRDGDNGIVPLIFRRFTTKFESRSKVDDEDVPSDEWKQPEMEVS